MSFIDTLRNSRTSKTAVLHQFLTNYDPSSPKYYLFVEGDPDRSFYRSKLSMHIQAPQKLIFYNCEGKANVFKAFQDIRARYPKISTAFFFVDKDVDDIIGKQWPPDPRVFTTDVYSIENYLVVRECLEGYIGDHIKVRRVNIDTGLILAKFESELAQFHRLILPIMAWIVAMRRRGLSINLNDVNLAELFEIKDSTLRRKHGRCAIKYLTRVTQVTETCDWRILRQTALELKRLRPQSFTRGKFEAWWFTHFVADSCKSISLVAKESGGSMAQAVGLTTGNIIQLLSPSCPQIQALTSFAEFHFKAADKEVPAQAKKSRWKIMLGG